MATTAVTAERDNYLNQEYGIKSWLLTIDHKFAVGVGVTCGVT